MAKEVAKRSSANKSAERKVKVQKSCSATTSEPRGEQTEKTAGELNYSKSFVGPAATVEDQRAKSSDHHQSHT